MSMQEKCPDCGVAIGELHVDGCDIETCPKCGGQLLSCSCIEDVNDNNDDSVKDATGARTDMWGATWGLRRIPWAGVTPAMVACREFDWFCKYVPGQGYEMCDRNDPEAFEDLNRLYTCAKWNSDTQKWTCAI